MGFGRGPPTRALERRIVMFDCELLTEQKYSFTDTVYFFTYNRRANATKALVGKHSAMDSACGVGGSLKTTIVSPSSLRAGFDASAATAVWMSPEAYRLLGGDFRKNVSAVSAMPGSSVDSGSCVRIRKLLEQFHPFFA